MASPYDQERIQRPLLERGSLSYSHSCSPASSLTFRISQERLGYAALTNKPDSSVAYPREVYFLLMLHAPAQGLQGCSAHCGHLRTRAEEGFVLTRASHYYLGWRREGSKPFTGSPSIHLELTHCTSARLSLAKASHMAMPNFKSL